MSFTYEYPAHYVSVDQVIFGAEPHSSLQILLIERADPGQPFHGSWALPGGFVEPTESLDTAAARELREETGVDNAFLEQLYTFGDPKRDPRGRVITVAYYALVRLSQCKVQAGSDAARARWFELSEIGDLDLAFDHEAIITKAILRLRAKVRYEPIGFNLLPEKFTIAQLHSIYEAILDRPIDLPNFRRNIARMDFLRPAGEEKNVGHRPGKLYRFDVARYTQLVRRGFNFEI